jgi:hypothetical protein
MLNTNSQTLKAKKISSGYFRVFGYFIKVKKIKIKIITFIGGIAVKNIPLIVPIFIL